MRNSIIEPPFPCLKNMDANRVSHPVKKPIKFFGKKKTSENVLFASDSAFMVFVQICLKKTIKNVSFYNNKKNVLIFKCAM